MVIDEARQAPYVVVVQMRNDNAIDQRDKLQLHHPGKHRMATIDEQMQVAKPYNCRRISHPRFQTTPAPRKFDAQWKCLHAFIIRSTNDKETHAEALKQ
jgi:hypothetical protein